MRKIFIALFLCLILCCVSSCSTTQTLRISGRPGTEIYSANMTKVAVVPQSGTADVKISADDFNAFMYSHENGSDKYVPFAINYKTDRHMGAKTLAFLSVGVECAGALAFIIACFSEGGVGLILGGAGAMGLGLGGSIPMSYRCVQDQYVNCYSYLTDQKTNQDIAFSPLVQTADYKMSSKNNPKHVEGKKQPAVKDYETKGNTKVKSEDKVIESGNRQDEDRTIVVSRPPETHAVVEKDESSIDYSNSVVGTYIGKGRILEAGEVAERFNKMTVVIKQCSDNLVKVSVKVNVLPFFRNDSRYVVSKSNGVYVLKNKDLDSTIKIDENGDMTYECRNMIERGSNGILKITAEVK